MTGQSRLWIVVADGARARIVIPGATAEAFRTETTLESPGAGKSSADLGTDRPGRSFESAGAARHAIQPRHDPHTEEERKFERAVAEHLNDASARGAFDRLVLVAPAKASHEIRHALDQGTAAKLAGTLVKDLTNVPDHALGPHLAEWARPAPPGSG